MLKHKLLWKICRVPANITKQASPIPNTPPTSSSRTSSTPPRPSSSCNTSLLSTNSTSHSRVRPVTNLQVIIVGLLQGLNFLTTQVQFPAFLSIVFQLWAKYLQQPCFHPSSSIHYAAYLQTNKAKAQSCWRIAGDVPSTSIRWILQKTCHVQLNPFDHAIKLGSRYTGWSATVLRSCAQSLWWCHWKNWCDNPCESNQTNIFRSCFYCFPQACTLESSLGIMKSGKDCSSPVTISMNGQALQKSFTAVWKTNLGFLSPRDI